MKDREKGRKKVDELEGLFVSICLFVLFCLRDRESEIVKIGGRGQKFTAEQVAVICSCRVQCHFYNGTKDGIAVNPVSCDLTSR